MLLSQVRYRVSASVSSALLRSSTSLLVRAPQHHLQHHLPSHSLHHPLCRAFGYLSKKSPAAAAVANEVVPSTSSAPPQPSAAPSLYGGVKRATPAPTSSTSPSTSSSTPLTRPSPPSIPSSYDLIIIGGGSGGLALSKEASHLNQRVLLLDYVERTPHGSSWGLGGTCVNVGCIPKKLMHQAAGLGEDMKEAEKFGWSVTPNDTAASSSSSSAHSITQSSSSPQPLHLTHSWSALVLNVQQYIRSLNFGYRSRVMKDEKITYLNAKGKLVKGEAGSESGEKLVETTDTKGVVRVMRAKKVVIATGGKPRYPSIPGAELGITSDDIFSLKTSPGKTLVIGAGYIALESAGFLHGLGFDTHVMARSRYLRGFDEDISEKIVAHMKSLGVKFIEKTVPVKMEKVERANGASHIRVTSRTGSVESSEIYDTVLFAIGRDPRTKDLGLEDVGVMLDQSGTGQHGKVVLADSGLLKKESETKDERDPDETSVRGIYALGDVAMHRLELTPVAIGSAKMLARRLFSRASQQSNSSSSTSPSPLHTHPLILDYKSTPTTVFTPLEYGCVGLSEEEARKRFEQHDQTVEVYHSHFKPLSWALTDRGENVCYIKIITIQPSSLDTSCMTPHEFSSHQTIVGLHYLGPNAGEVIQGYSVALSKGLMKSDLDDAIGIHPTAAEEMLTVEVTKSSGVDPQKTGC